MNYELLYSEHLEKALNGALNKIEINALIEIGLFSKTNPPQFT
jgi:hypothetical protein